MDFIEVKTDMPVQIQSYQPGEVKISQKVYTQSVIVSGQNVIENTLPQTFDELTVEHLKQVVALKPEIVIIGTGEKHTFPKTSLRDFFTQHHVGVEFMDTAAACRTFQILTSEKRKVVAVLFI